MSFQVSVSPSGRQFQAEIDETLLAAALRQGIALPYGCKNGACGSCKGTVLTGNIVQHQHAASALSEQEKKAGKALFCSAHAHSDLTIECHEIAHLGNLTAKKLPSRVVSMQRAADDVMILQLQLPAGEQLQFLAGQYIDILLKDGKRRSYSLAKPPHAQGPIELHIRHTPGGLFTDFVFGTQTQVMKERDILRFEGPLGSFFLREDTDKPIVMLASGTGFAPIKSIIEHMMQADIQRPITLYWGGRRPQDLYLNALCLEWANTLPYFTYVPVISDAMPQDNWQGRIGFVHQAVLDDLSDLSGHHVYACGAPIMVDTARATFTTQAGLPDHDFFADAFISENDLQAVS